MLTAHRRRDRPGNHRSAGRIQCSAGVFSRKKNSRISEITVAFP
jgi:hypothetical protein